MAAWSSLVRMMSWSLPAVDMLECFAYRAADGTETLHAALRGVLGEAERHSAKYRSSGRAQALQSSSMAADKSMMRGKGDISDTATLEESSAPRRKLTARNRIERERLKK